MPSVSVKRSGYDHLEDSPQIGSTNVVSPGGSLQRSTSDFLTANNDSVIRRERSSSAVSNTNRGAITRRFGSLSRNRGNSVLSRKSNDKPGDGLRNQLDGSRTHINVVDPDGAALSLDSQGGRSLQRAEEEGLIHDDIVEHLDVIDAQVGTMSALTNAANSVVLPPFSIYHRRPVIHIGSPNREDDTDKESGLPSHDDSLDRHVEDVLKSPSKLRRTLAGVWSFLKTPLGIIAGFYGFLVVFWGAAIVFFLAKWINFNNDYIQGFWVEVSSQVVNALFTLTGVGLLPVRVLDTTRIVKVWLYKRRTRRLRAIAGLAPLYDEDDLPDPAYDPNFVHVLNEKEQRDLHRQQEKFRESQTWYRPHGTETHRAFPINTALWICIANDANSVFQIILCGTMWGLDRFQRPAWSTGILIPLGFICGITAGVLIWRGGAKTKRVVKVEELLRQALDERPRSRQSDSRSQDDNASVARSISKQLIKSDSETLEK